MLYFHLFSSNYCLIFVLYLLWPTNRLHIITSISKHWTIFNRYFFYWFLISSRGVRLTWFILIYFKFIETQFMALPSHEEFQRSRDLLISILWCAVTIYSYVICKKKKNIGRKKSKYQLRKYINSNYNEKPQFDPNVTSKCSVFPYNFPILLILIIHFIVIWPLFNLFLYVFLHSIFHSNAFP